MASPEAFLESSQEAFGDVGLDEMPNSQEMWMEMMEELNVDMEVVSLMEESVLEEEDNITSVSAHIGVIFTVEFHLRWNILFFYEN